MHVLCYCVNCVHFVYCMYRANRFSLQNVFLFFSSLFVFFLASVYKLNRAEWE